LLWGIDQLFYHPWPATALFVAATALGTGAALTASCRAAFERALVEAAARVGSFWLKCGMCAFATVLAYFLRVRAHLLGDSDAWFRNLRLAFKGEQAEQVAWIQGPEFGGLDFIPLLEPLDYILHLQAFRLGHFLWDWNPADAYACLSIIAYGGYVWVLAKIACCLYDDVLHRYVLWTMLVTLGSSQLFWGMARAIRWSR